MDVFTPEKRSKVMSAIRSKDTTPELVVRRALHRAGYRYSLHRKDLPGRPDIVLPKYRTAIQVRGCFWHGHVCFDGHVPKSRVSYWKPKIENNKKRDLRNDRKLRGLGWKLVVIWACQVEQEKKLTKVLKRTCQILKKQRTVRRT